MKIKFILSIIIISSLNCLYASKPVSFDLGMESGYFKSDILGDRLLIRWIGRLTYAQKFENNYINIKGRISPDLYGSSLDASALKLSGEINLGGNFKTINWQTNISSRNYYYRSDRFNDVTFNIFQLGFLLNRSMSNKYSIHAGFDYFYRKNDEQPRNEIDDYRYSIAAVYRLNLFNFLSCKLELEKFLIMRRKTIYTQNENKGIRIGPVISYNHRSKHLINLSYELMHHSTELFDEEYWEHRIHILWGHYFTKKWSVFLFVNYLFRPDQHPDETMIELTYTSANNETGYHLKLGHDFTKSTELYFKVGYTKDELLYQNTNLAGWQYLVGMNFKF